MRKRSSFQSRFRRRIPVIEPVLQGGTDLKLCVYLAVLFSALLASGATSSILNMTPPISGLALVDLRDSFEEFHSGHRHEAIDILEPRGTPVHAVVSGTIRKLFSANRAAIPSTSSMKRGCIATTTLTWTSTRKGCGRECGSSVGMSSGLWDRQETRMCGPRTCILQSSSWSRKGSGGRGRLLTHIQAS